MKHVLNILGIVAIVGFLAAGARYSEASPTQDLVQPVGIIELFKPDHPKYPFNRATGVFVSPTQVLTSAHVVDESKDGVITQFRMENGDTYNITDIQRSKDMDLGILTVDKPYKGFIPTYNCEPQNRGTELTTVGNPLVMEFIESKIMVTGGRPSIRAPESIAGPEKKSDNPNTTRNTPDEARKKFTVIPPDQVAPKQAQEKPANLTGAQFFQGVALPGQSGSPVYDKNGQIVGIVAITIVDGNSGAYAGIGMYLATSTACEFLKDSIKL